MTARRAIGHCTGEESTDTGMIVGIVIVWMCSFGFNSLRSGEGGGMERGVVAGGGRRMGQESILPGTKHALKLLVKKRMKPDITPPHTSTAIDRTTVW